MDRRTETRMSRDAQDALLSVAQAATLLGVHPNTVRSWTDGGRLTAYRINARGDRRFRRDEVERILVEDAPAIDGEPGVSDRAGRECRARASSSASRPASPPARRPRSVARALVEALRTELHVERAAVYVLADERLELRGPRRLRRRRPSALARSSAEPSRERHRPRDPAGHGRRGPDRSSCSSTRASADRMPPSFMRAIAIDRGHRPRPARGSSSVRVASSVAPGRCARSPRS